MAKLKAAAVALKIREHRGNLAAVGRDFNATRSAVHMFVYARPALLAICQECRETMKDNAESVLYKAVLAGEAWAVQFYLRTQGHDRGYTERVEHQGQMMMELITEIVSAGDPALPLPALSEPGTPPPSCAAATGG